MNFSPSVLFSVGLSFVAFASTSEAFPVINATTNRLFVMSPMGEALVPAGTQLAWHADTGESVSFSTNGVDWTSFTVQSGHEYSIYCGSLGPSLVDASATQTKWFFLGFGTVFSAGMLGLGARWVGRILGTGGGYNE